MRHDLKFREGMRKTKSTIGTDHLQSLEPRRLFAGGDIDPTFGNGGIVKLPSQPAQMTANDAQPLAGGKFLVGGSAGAGDYELRQFKPDGSLDTTFGGTGDVTGKVVEDSDIQVMQIAPDGKIVAILSNP